MTIRLDCTQFSVVVYCTLCPEWRRVRLTKGEAWDVAAAHEEHCHTTDTQARSARNTYLKRVIRVEL